MNSVNVTGRMVRDPQTKTTNGGRNVVEFVVAVDKLFKPKDDSPSADFFRVKCWDRTAEYIGNFGAKGRLVAVTGRLETRKYTDKDGHKREIIEIVADRVNLLDRPQAEATPPEEPATTPAQTEEYDPFADE
jgi:single-strand DNA-binding protein